MTEFRAKSETLPIEVQVIEALRLKAQAMATADGYFFDYDKADVWSEEFEKAAAAGKVGNVVLIYDDNEDAHELADENFQRWMLKLSIYGIVKEELGEDRHRTEWRLVADLKKMFKAFLNAQNGVLIGPGRITHVEHDCLGNGQAWALCEAEVMIEHVCGDATAQS
jgi:hypothetical protein